MTVEHYPKTREIYSHTGLRGIAALSVMIAHANNFNFAIIGVLNSSLLKILFAWHEYAVDLFFMLSGFILHWVYVNPKKPIHWKTYTVARFARIAPLYYFTLLFFLPLPIYSMLKHGLEFVHSYYPIALILNLVMSSGFILGSAVNAPAWSVSVEMFLYFIIFPILCILLRKSNSCKYSNIISLILILSLSLVCINVYEHQLYKITFNSGLFIVPGNLIRGLCGFTIGFIVCMWFKKYNNLFFSIIKLDFYIWFLFAAFIASRLSLIPQISVLLIFPFIIFFAAYDKGSFAKILKLSPIQWLGERSYSIYLWHFPIMCFASSLLSKAGAKTTQSLFRECWVIWFFYISIIIISLLISEASYRYFEVPSRKYIRSIT